MNIACQRGQILDVGHVLLVVQYGFVEVRYAPAQGDVVDEKLAQLGSGPARVGVAPRAEGHQNLLLFVEGHVAVHHGTETNGGQRLYLAVIFFQHILPEVGVAILKAIPNGFGGVGPQSVYQLVLPRVASLSNGLVLWVDENCLNTG